jgi:hypothetical protein
MSRIDVNRLLALVALIVIVVIAAASNYRFEIGALGLKFERNSGIAERGVDEQTR